jgi:hypothetical protein
MGHGAWDKRLPEVMGVASLPMPPAPCPLPLIRVRE